MALRKRANALSLAVRRLMVVVVMSTSCLFQCQALVVLKVSAVIRKAATIASSCEAVPSQLHKRDSPP